MSAHRSFRDAVPAAALALALALTLLVLSGCDADRTPTPSPAPVPLPTTMTAGDPSVPPAAAVLATPAGGASAADPTGRTNKAMTRTEESAAMPMPGQNNDHSAALASPKPATAASAP